MLKFSEFLIFIVLFYPVYVVTDKVYEYTFQLAILYMNTIEHDRSQIREAYI